MENQIAETSPSNGQLAQAFSDTAQSSGLSLKDIRIPALFLKQGLSEGVAEGTYKMGDIYHSEQEDVVGAA